MPLSLSFLFSIAIMRSSEDERGIQHMKIQQQRKMSQAGPLQRFWSGIGAFQARLNRQKALYAELFSCARESRAAGPVAPISDPSLFQSTIREFGPTLEPSVRPDLSRLYDIAVDRITGTLIIANRGATLMSFSPRTQTPFIVRHIGLSLYVPGLGLETVNAGLTGNIYDGPIACRGESACTPSFLFGSQRCNCAHQWDSFRETAAVFNKAELPSLYGAQFEHWVQRQVTYSEGRHIFLQPGPGFVMLHMDSQNGMGSGSTSGEFSVDLFNRASLRHRGEYSAEQILGASMADAFDALGLHPDPRSDCDELGYKIFPVVLDYLDVSKDLLFFSNNPRKLAALRNRGYSVSRIKSLGAVNAAGAMEADQRGREFGHMDISGHEVSFQDELRRVRKELCMAWGRDFIDKRRRAACLSKSAA